MPADDRADEEEQQEENAVTLVSNVDIGSTGGEYISNIYFFCLAIKKKVGARACG